MKFALKTIFVTVLITLHIQCGLTVTGNPGQDEGKKNQISLAMSFISQHFGDQASFTFRKAEDHTEQQQTVSYDETPSEVSFNTSALGVYLLSADLGERRVKFSTYVRSQDSGQSELEKSCARQKELKAAKLPIGVIQKQLEEKPQGNLHVVSVMSSPYYSCLSDLELPSPPKSGEESPTPQPKPDGFVEVIVSESDTILFLASPEELTWVIQQESPGSLKGIYLSGAPSKVANVPEGVPVFREFTGEDTLKKVVAYIEHFDQAFKLEFDQELGTSVCTDIPLPLTGMQNLAPCTTPEQLAAAEIAMGNMDAQLDHIKSVTGISSIKSVQSKEISQEFIVAPYIEGIHVKQEKILEVCYREPSGKIQQFWPGSRNELGTPIGEYCYKSGHCVSPQMVDGPGSETSCPKPLKFSEERMAPL